MVTCTKCTCTYIHDSVLIRRWRLTMYLFSLCFIKASFQQEISRLKSRVVTVSKPGHFLPIQFWLLLNTPWIRHNKILCIILQSIKHKFIFVYETFRFISTALFSRVQPLSIYAHNHKRYKAKRTYQ